MVHFPPLPSPDYVFIGRYSGMSQSGFPHSEIPGSKPACGSPRLIAACHVLHRRLVPRHPPLRTFLLDRHPHAAGSRNPLPVSPKSRHSFYRHRHLNQTSIQEPA